MDELFNKLATCASNLRGNTSSISSDVRGVLATDRHNLTLT